MFSFAGLFLCDFQIYVTLVETDSLLSEQLHVMEQILSTGRALFKPRRQNSAKNETSASATTGQPEAAPTTLFPISELLEQLLRQEAELWKKNEGLPSTIKGAYNYTVAHSETKLIYMYTYHGCTRYM